LRYLLIRNSLRAFFPPATAARPLIKLIFTHMIMGRSSVPYA
jgi:hypothetical protein